MANFHAGSVAVLDALDLNGRIELMNGRQRGEDLRHAHVG